MSLTSSNFVSTSVHYVFSAAKIIGCLMLTDFLAPLVYERLFFIAEVMPGSSLAYSIALILQCRLMFHLSYLIYAPTQYREHRIWQRFGLFSGWLTWNNFVVASLLFLFAHFTWGLDANKLQAPIGTLEQLSDYAVLIRLAAFVCSLTTLAYAVYWTLGYLLEEKFESDRDLYRDAKSDKYYIAYTIVAALYLTMPPQDGDAWSLHPYSIFFALSLIVIDTTRFFIDGLLKREQLGRGAKKV
ncbi:hypothetical protein [Vibrio sp. WXL210]|uniref:hypothetical protein n=1 Tax=Vibrio sp. WXL210 TaxID=3450709 RepID=UPI003EC4FDBE